MMMQRHLVFFLEEASAKALLEGLLPKLKPAGMEIETHCQVFQGKTDLERKLVRRIREWRAPGVTCFIVLRDQDAAACTDVAAKLRALCAEGGRPDAVARVACREMESWYLGDLAAVEKGLSLSGLAVLQDKKTYRDPDRLGSPSRELKRVTHLKYQKVEGSRRIGPHLRLQGNRSTSFNKFVEGVRRCVERLGAA